jgi:Ca2+-binding RTX toxin-like protein
MSTIQGTHHDDDLTGTDFSDQFLLGGGGNDAAHGKDGDDTFRMNAALNGLDAIDGGKDHDLITLDGDYSAGVVFGADTITRVEAMKLSAGFDYNLTTNDGNVGADKKLVVKAGTLGSGDTLTFNGSAETDGRFVVTGGAGNDVLTGGAQGDEFRLTQGGTDHVHAGGGDDTISMGALTASHVIDGGAGFDILEITGAVGSDVVSFTASTMTGIDRLVLTQSNIFDVLTHDATVAAGATLEVDLSASTANYSFNGQQETDGHFDLLGGSGIGLLRGGAQTDTISVVAHATGGHVALLNGGGGADDITCNTGVDRITLNAVSDSTSTGRDTVHGFDADADQFDLTVSITGFDGVHDGTHSISGATFDSDMGLAINDFLASNHAVIIHATSGDLSGHQFLIADVNGNSTYDGGTDYVFDVTGFTGTFDAGDFV